MTAALDRLRRRARPNRWSALFGAVSAGCLGLLVVTGLMLMVFYSPSGPTVSYQGSYPLLRGLPVSAAYASVLHLSFDVPGGLLLRQAHHWAALVLPASLLLQLLTTFFSGTFRRPRQWAWVLLFAVFVLALVSGWSGYALPDDTLSGTGLRIVEGVTLAIPFAGTWASWLLFGGEFPGSVIGHLYLVHLVAPALLIVAFLLRRRLSGPRPPLAYAAGLVFVTQGVLVLMAGTLQISPVWAYGPASSGNAFAGSQPDWYTAFLDGALRLVPSGWEVFWAGRTWTLAVLVPLASIGLFFATVAGYPFLEARVTRDRRLQLHPDRPRDTPVRTGLGVAGMVFYGALWAAGSADVVATQFAVSFEGVIWFLRGVAVLGPAVGFLVTTQVCATLRSAEQAERQDGAETGVISRSPDGGYSETHRPVAARPAGQLSSG